MWIGPNRSFCRMLIADRLRSSSTATKVTTASSRSSELEYQLEELYRAGAQPFGDGIQLLIQRPGPPCDDKRARRDARKDAVEGDH